MGQIVIDHLDDRALAKLQQRARERGIALGDLMRAIIEADALLSPSPVFSDPARLSEEERSERERIAARTEEIRARTLKPLWANSTLLIREDRDRR
jgi:hypothetical protein